MKLVLSAMLFILASQQAAEPIAPPTEREIIDALTDMNWRHVDMPPLPQGIGFNGLTDFENRTVWLVSSNDLAGRRKTVLHELTHIALRMRGLNYDDEAEVYRIVEAEFARLYGKEH